MFALLLFTTCEKDDYEAGLKAPDKDSNMPELVEGRIALAYVTSWSTVIPPIPPIPDKYQLRLRRTLYGGRSL